MHPFVNVGRRVIFWWSAKCGCTTVKSIMVESMAFDFVSRRMDADESLVRSAVDRVLYRRVGPDGSPTDRLVSRFLAEAEIDSLHCPAAGSLLLLPPWVASEFVNVLFVRDPFDRFASGVVDKHVDGSFSRFFRPSSFRDACSRIDMLEPHHFAPQASWAFLPDLRYDRVFDIGSIDYEYLSGLLGMRVAPRVMHRRAEFSDECPPGLPDMGYDELADLKRAGRVPRYGCFYDDECRAMVARHYAADLELVRRWLPPEAS